MILCIRVLYINIYMHYRSKKVGNIGQRKRIRPEDVTQMQYAVLVEQQRKLREQTTFYMLMNEKLRRELSFED